MMMEHKQANQTPVQTGVFFSVTTRSRFCIAFVTALLALSRGVFAAEVDPAQMELHVAPAAQWVIPYDVNSAPGTADAVRVRHLYSSEQMRRDTDGKTWYYHQYRSQPLTTTGLDEASTATIAFRAAYERLVVHHINVEREGQVIDRLADATVKFASIEEEANSYIYTGGTLATIILNDTRTNDIIDIAYTIEGQNPIFGDGFHDWRQFGWDDPVDKVLIRYSVPEALPLRIQVDNSSAVPAESVEDGYRIVELALDNVPAQIMDENYPPYLVPYPMITASSYASWEAISTWASGLFAAGSTGDADVQRLFERLTAAAATDEEFVLVALEYVQNQIRYISLSTGVNSHLPRAPGEVLRSGFGDCKDKSQLLATLLNARGIPATPVLVSTVLQREIGNHLPNPGVFDHAIAQLTLDGVDYWLDPTATYQAGDLDTIVIGDYGLALDAGPAARGLVTMPRKTEFVSEIEVIETMESLNFEPSIEYTVESHYKGASAEAMRAYFANVSLQQIQSEFIDFYSPLYGRVIADGPVTYEDDTATNTFVVHESYVIGNYWTDAGPLVSGDIHHTIIASNLTSPTSLSRKLPFFTGEPIRVRNRFSFRMHPETDLAWSNDTTNFRMEGAVFRSTSSMRDGVYEADLEFTRTLDSVHPEDMDDYYDMISGMEQALSYSLNVPLPFSVVAEKSTAELGEFLDYLKELPKQQEQATP